MNFALELKKINIPLTEKAEIRFKIYYESLVEVNQKMNLTAITEEKEVYRKHFLDSLEIVRALPMGYERTLCDVGSGAGFPSIPYAIVDEKIKVTIVDALNKRITFLNDLTKKLGLQNVEAIHARAEDFAKIKREAFDVVTARAVARLNVLAELCLPLTKVGGLFIAMKGSSGSDELKEAETAIKTLGGKVEKVIKVELPQEQDKREIIVIRKVSNTPSKYPRAFGVIKERPIA